MIDIKAKITNVILSCKTTTQLDVAYNYIKQARKQNLIGDKLFYFMYGTINTLQGVFKSRELSK